MDYQEKVLGIILHGGNARSLAMEAILKAKEGNISAARKSLEEAEKELNLSHNIQTQLIQDEAAGSESEITLLLIHAQDHFMNAMTVKDLAYEFIDLYENLYRR